MSDDSPYLRDLLAESKKQTKLLNDIAWAIESLNSSGDENNGTSPAPVIRPSNG